MSDKGIIKGIVRDTVVGIAVLILTPIALSILAYSYSALGAWSLVAGLSVSLAIALGFLWSRNGDIGKEREETRMAEANLEKETNNRKSLEETIPILKSQIGNLEKDARKADSEKEVFQADKMRLDASVGKLEAENRKLRSLREQPDSRFTEMEAGEFVLNGLEAGMKVSSRLISGLSKNDLMEVGAASDSTFKVHIMRIKNTGTGEFYDFERSDPVKSWRRTFTIPEDGDYAVVLESVLGSGVVYLSVSTYSPVPVGIASVHVEGW